MRTNTLGALGIAAVVAFVGITVGAYRHTFSNAVVVEVSAPRAGLLLDPGAEVKLRGMVVGEVRSVATTANGALISIALDRSQAGHIASNVTATVDPSSVFGGKYIELVPPTHPGPAITAGSMIRAASVAPEIDDLFGQTQQLLKAIPIDKVDIVLSTLAHTLDGHGDQLGRTLTSLDSYLKTLNAHSSQINADLNLAPSVLQTYADLAPTLLDILKHSTVTATTLTARAADLNDLLSAAGSAADVGTAFVNTISPSLEAASHNLDPVTRLLALYSPEYPCVLQAWSNLATNNHQLGDTYPGAQVVMTLLPGQNPYQNPRDLPQFVNNRGPQCYALPSIGKNPPRQDLNDGEHAYGSNNNQLTLGNPVITFFGSGSGK